MVRGQRQVLPWPMMCWRYSTFMARGPLTPATQPILLPIQVFTQMVCGQLVAQRCLISSLFGIVMG